MNNNMIIGFTNKFYTLWNVVSETRDFGCGVEKITKYIYKKNISMDESIVRSLYPNVEIDMTLRGHFSFVKSSEKIYDWSLFTYGRYKGEKIENCTDFSYMIWYRNDGCNDISKSIIDTVLINNGYYIINDSVMSQSEYNKYLSEKDRINNILEEINNGNYTFFAEKNLDEEGNYSLESGIYIHFNNFKEQCYAGYLYALPMINGKAKRMKNKNIKLTNYTLDKKEYYTVINVESFEIVK